MKNTNNTKVKSQIEEAKKRVFIDVNDLCNLLSSTKECEGKDCKSCPLCLMIGMIWKY